MLEFQGPWLLLTAGIVLVALAARGAAPRARGTGSPSQPGPTATVASPRS